MFSHKHETIIAVLLLAIMGVFMLGVGVTPKPVPVAPVAVFMFGMAVAGILGAILGWQSSRDENLGKMVEAKDLAPGRYLIGKDSYGRVVISTHLYAVRCTEGAPAVRLFDHTTASIPAQYFCDLPIGGSVLVEKASCGGWSVMQGMMA